MGIEPRLKNLYCSGKTDVSFLGLVHRMAANKLENVYKVHPRYKELERQVSIQGAYNLVLKISNYEKKEYLKKNISS